MRALCLPFRVVLMTPPVMLAGIDRGGDSGSGRERRCGVGGGGGRGGGGGGGGGRRRSSGLGRCLGGLGKRR